MTLLEIDIQYISLAVSLIGLAFIVLLLTSFKKLRLEIVQKSRINIEGNNLKLQALERLTLYAERSGLKNLIERIGNKGMSTADLHHILIDTLKTEFEYNQSQQIYVSPEVWNAITRLKDQNIYIINHITANLPPYATAMDLSRLIIEYSITPNAELNTIVLDALQFEAKKILS